MMERTPILPPTILIVEDSPDDAQVVKMTFDEAGIANPLVFVEDGESALRYLRGEGRYYDRDQWPLPLLMILDVNLPRRSGLEVLEETQELRERNGIHAVVLSVGDLPADRERALAFGAEQVLRKPIEPRSLLKIISKIAAFSLLIVPAVNEDIPSFLEP